MDDFIYLRNDRMMDYYLQNIIDHFWQEDDRKEARFRCFDFILGEYQLEHIDFEVFNMLFDFIYLVSKLYDKQKDKE